MYTKQKFIEIYDLGVICHRQKKKKCVLKNITLKYQPERSTWSSDVRDRE